MILLIEAHQHSINTLAFFKRSSAIYNHMASHRNVSKMSRDIGNHMDCNDSWILTDGA